MGIRHHLNTDAQVENFNNLIAQARLLGKPVTVEFISNSNPKTDAQRSSIHVWMRQVADLLNEKGIDKLVVIEKLEKRGIDMPWSDSSFKADVYKPIFQRVFPDKESTEQASTKDHDIVYHGLIKWFAEEFELQLPPWPTRDSPHDGE